MPKTSITYRKPRRLSDEQREGASKTTNEENQSTISYKKKCDIK